MRVLTWLTRGEVHELAVQESYLDIQMKPATATRVHMQHRETQLSITLIAPQR